MQLGHFEIYILKLINMIGGTAWHLLRQHGLHRRACRELIGNGGEAFNQTLLSFSAVEYKQINVEGDRAALT